MSSQRQTRSSAPASTASRKPPSKKPASTKRTPAAKQKTTALKEPEPLTERELATLHELQRRNQERTSIAQAEKDDGM